MNLYTKIIINNWISNDKFTRYERFVYKDDNLENAIVKLAKSIENTNRFYVWKGNISLLFNFNEIKWIGYSPNPLEAKELKSKQLNDPVIYNYNNKLTRTTNGRRRRCQEIHCECSRRPPREGLSRWCSFPLSISSVCDR